MAVRFQGSTSSVTTGGDHLTVDAGAAAGAAVAIAGTGAERLGSSVGNPEAGIKRSGEAGDFAGAATARGQGSTIKPCWASAALPTSRQATRARRVDGCPTA